MSVVNIIQQLFDNGRIVFENERSPSAKDLLKAEEFVLSFERDYRTTLPAVAPEVDRVSLRWALETFSLIAQRIAYQHLAPQLQIQTAKPDDKDPTTCYSVDLVFRFLPDLQRLASAAQCDEVLLKTISELANEWPLSSVGITIHEECAPSAFLAVPCLKWLYVDRILATRDLSRVQHPEVRELIKEAIGANPQLAPGLFQKIQEIEEVESCPTPRS